MLRSIDHIVILARDLTGAMAAYERCGFTVTPGGKHAHGYTHNALISFGDGSYFELIAFVDPTQPSPHRWRPRLDRAEGLVDYCLASSDLRADARSAQHAGLPYNDPADAGRLRPDGQRIEWRTAAPPGPVGSHALPFAIEDVTPRDLRVPAGAALNHPNGVKRVAGLTMVVADLAGTARAMTSLLGVEPRAASPTIPGAGGSLLYRLGPHWLEYVQPIADDTPGAEESALARHLREVGQGPYEVVLSVSHPGAPGGGDLLPRDTCGARIRIVPN